MSSWLAEAFSGRLAVSVMIGTSCPSRDDPLKEYSMLFPSKLNTQEFLFFVLWCNTDLSICPGIRDARHQSFSASTQPSQTRHARPKGTDFMGEKHSYSLVSSKSARSRHCNLANSARSRHYYLAKSAWSRHYHLASDHKMNERSPDMYCYSVYTIHHAFKSCRTKTNVVYDICL